jgi:DNA-binding response OmpR family regulator
MQEEDHKDGHQRPDVSFISRAMHVLVVDDDKEVRTQIAGLLERDGFEVDTASDGGAGWDAFRARAYDLLITDHVMPVLRGADLLRKVRGVSRDVPCILISSEIPWHEPDLSAVLQPGAAVEKSFSLREVRDKARELLVAR